MIDNPEAYLHPEFQRKLVRVLKNIQKEMKIQIILATHSQEIIDECEKDEIIVIEDEEVLKRKEKNTGDTSKSEMTGEQLSLEF